MTLLSPNHNHAADECIAQIPQHHIPTQEEKVRASERFDKSVLMAAHMAALHDAYIMEMATHPVNEVNIKPASPTSSIGGLKPSTLKQLKIGKVHRRRVVNGTLCSKALCTKTHSGLMVVNVFEDEEGNATPIYLSNAMEGNGGSAQAQRFYPQDSKVAVKEPYLTRLPDGEIVLLVEKMTDLVFLWVPDFVEEDEGLKNDGMRGDGREVFAMEKGEEDGLPLPDGNRKALDNGNVSEEASTGDVGKVSSASRELNFGDVMGVKEQVDGPDIAGTGNADGVSAATDVTGNDPNVKFPCENGTEEVDQKDEGEVQLKEQVKTDEATRDLSMEDMLSMCKSKGGNGNSVEVQDGECNNVAEVNDKESDDVSGQGQVVCRDVVQSEVQPVKHVGDADEGETAASLRSKGNALFAREEYNKATDLYTRAAEKARRDKLKQEEVLCLSNRAEVWLRLCRNQAALDDAEAALKVLRELENGVNGADRDLALAKALFRKGRALMGLHKYEDAMRVLQEVLGKAPADRQLKEAARKCRDRLQRVLKPGKRQRAAMNRKKTSASFMLQ